MEKQELLKWARFKKDGNILFGRVEGDHVRVSQGTVFDNADLTETVVALSDLKLLPPSLPTKVVCVAHNYRGLIEQIGEPFPEEPILFLKPPSCLIGQGGSIVIPSDAQRVIFEGELAVIIKNEMNHVPADQTLSYVAGYSCFNDTTERAMIERDHYMLSLGKGMDTFGPCGPFLVDGVNPNTLNIATFLNGKEMQRDNTSNCIFSVEFLLEYICHRITLYPGDIVTTGTPQGVDTLNPGDVVEVEIEKVGRLRNFVDSEPE